MNTMPVNGRTWPRIQFPLFQFRTLFLNITSFEMSPASNRRGKNAVISKLLSASDSWLLTKEQGLGWR